MHHASACIMPVHASCQCMHHASVFNNKAIDLVLAGPKDHTEVIIGPQIAIRKLRKPGVFSGLMLIGGNGSEWTDGGNKQTKKDI